VAALECAAMRLPPPLHLSPRHSRIGRAAIVAGSLVTEMLMVALPLPWFCGISAVVAIAAVGRRAMRNCAGPGVPSLLLVGADRRISVRDARGRLVRGTILDATYVGTALTSIVWRADGDARGWGRLLPPRALLILPDTLPPDDFRRLRVMLRYGRVAAPERDTSGTAAG
jgi:hypothetical protein